VTPFWLWVAIGCQISALLGFSAVRYGLPGARAVAGRKPERQQAQVEEAPVVAASAAPVRERAERRPARPPLPATPRAPAAARRRAAPAARPAPPPSVARPEAGKLALWARQVKAGERTFSLATDGCRVTWDRRCKHGHPSWLVHLGLLSPRRQPPRRHRPR
jgi:hypothetical protein